MPKILVVQWASSDNDSLLVLLDIAARELAAMGFDVQTITVDTPNWTAQLMQLLQAGGFSFALGMSGIGGDLMTDQKQYLWEAARIPFFMWYCDHPCYFPARHVRRNPFALHGYVFPDHAQFSQQVLSANGMTLAVHMGIPSREVCGQPLPAGQRNGRLMFSKGGGDPDQMARDWPSRFSPTLVSILHESADALYLRNTLDYHGTIAACAQSHGLYLSSDSALMMAMLLEMDRYIRTKRANQVVRRLIKYPVDVFGHGWNHLDKSGGRAEFKGAAPMAQVLQQLPSYVGCVSINPLVEGSVHDRVFCALQAGVAPVSDRNAFSRAAFPRLDGYSFEFDSDSIDAAIEAVLANPADAIEAADATYREALDRYSMRAGLRQIAEFCGWAAMNRSVLPT